MDLFQQAAAIDAQVGAPLAERMRPQLLSDVVGQDHLCAPGKLLHAIVESKRPCSLLFWGPPGCGKTTLAQLVARNVDAELASVSAVLAGVKELREEIATAQERWNHQRRRTVLFVDEIHRFNRAQQDALLPHVERGAITLFGATTENPSFSVNAALISRLRVATVRALDKKALGQLLGRAWTHPRGLGQKSGPDETLLAELAAASDGDARRALSALEVAAQLAGGRGGTVGGNGELQLNAEDIREALGRRQLRYDKTGDEHHAVVSAYIKSMRGSDADAAVYWLARMLEAGEDVRFVARRMVIFASEDVGNADPAALSVAVSAMQAAEYVGLPEATLPLTQATVYLSLAPKSNAAVSSYRNAKDILERTGTLPVPTHLLNASVPGNVSRARYQYPHDFPGAFVSQRYFPGNEPPFAVVELTSRGQEPALSKMLSELRSRLGYPGDAPGRTTGGGEGNDAQ